MKEYQRKIVVQGPIQYHVYVVLTDDVNASRIKRNAILGRDWPGLDCAVALHSGKAEDAVSYIFLPFNADPGDIVHETVHCVWRIMELIGAGHDEEIMAYFIGYIAERIMAVVYKYESRTEAIDNQPGKAQEEAEQHHKGKQQRKGSVIPVVLSGVPSTA